MDSVNTFELVELQPGLEVYFEKFNKAWLEEYFRVEDVDREVLEHPYESIINKGGSIWFVKQGDNIIGTAALRVMEPGVFELTKMAVDKAARGAGAGKFLCEVVLRKAKELGAEKVILYSQTSLAAAIGIYRKLGFREIPLEPGVYERADIKMELLFTERD